MYKHAIDICPDDLDELALRLDTLAIAGSEIVNVIWQPRRVVPEDQTAAYDTSGSFLIISKAMPTSVREVIDEEIARPAFA